MTPRARLLLSAALLAGAFVLLQLRSTGEAVPVRKALDTIPQALGDWQGREGTVLETGVLQVLKAKDYVVRRYTDPAGRSLWLFIGYWDTQRKGAQPHSPKNCLPGAGWEPLEAGRLTVPVPGQSAPLIVNRVVIQKEREQQVVLYWYQAQGRPVAGEVEARVEMVKSALWRNRTDGALVRVTAPVQGSLAETTQRLAAYVGTLYPVLGEYLPG
jgi:EpsI family protein